MATPAGKTMVEGHAVAVGMTQTGMETVRGLLETMKAQIQMALPRHMTAERMIRVALTSVQKNEKLLTCHPITLIGAIVQLAQLGLEPDDGTGKAYLIPFWNGKKGRMEVQAMPGYRGLVQLARNSGEIRDVIPHAVYAKDTFSYQFGTEQSLTHIPYDGPEPNRGKITHVYALARYRDNGVPAFDVMTIEQVEEIHKKVVEKNRPRSGKYKDGSPWVETGPWIDSYDEMAKKTIVRRLCKHLPASAELQRAITLDEKAEFAIPQDLGQLISPDEKSSEILDTPEAPKRLSESEIVKSEPLLESQKKALVDLMEDCGVSIDALNKYLATSFSVAGLDHVTQSQYAAVFSWIKNGQELDIGK